MTPHQMREKAADYHAQAKAYSPEFRRLLKSRFNSESERDRYNKIGSEMSRLDGLGFELERQADIMETNELLESLLDAFHRFKSISTPNKMHAIKFLSEYVRTSKI
jgi:hypothetical protein